MAHAHYREYKLLAAKKRAEANKWQNNKNGKKKEAGLGKQDQQITIIIWFPLDIRIYTESHHSSGLSYPFNCGVNFLIN